MSDKIITVFCSNSTSQANLGTCSPSYQTEFTMFAKAEPLGVAAALLGSQDSTQWLPAAPRAGLSPRRWVRELLCPSHWGPVAVLAVRNLCPSTQVTSQWHRSGWVTPSWCCGAQGRLARPSQCSSCSPPGQPAWGELQPLATSSRSSDLRSALPFAHP